MVEVRAFLPNNIERDLYYFTFGDKYFHAQLVSMYEILEQSSVTIGNSYSTTNLKLLGNLMKLLLSYSESLNNEEYVESDPPALFEFLMESLLRNSDTDCLDTNEQG